MMNAYSFLSSLTRTKVLDSEYPSSRVRVQSWEDSSVGKVLA